MAHAVSMKALFLRLGANQDTATYIVKEEGLHDLNALSRLSEKDVDEFCENVRFPGGNCSHNLSFRFRIHLHQTVFYMKMKRQVSRAVYPEDITVATISTSMLNLRRINEAKYSNPTQVKVEINRQDWSKTFSLFERALSTIKGIDGVPLSYCMRETEEVAAEADDPETNYTNRNSEMENRAPIVNAGPSATGYSATFIMDNRTVWDQVWSTFGNIKECYPHIYPFMKKEDGRGAILRLRLVMTGSQYVQNHS
jgi:hypothetical protein